MRNVKGVKIVSSISNQITLQAVLSSVSISTASGISNRVAVQVVEVLVL